MLYYSDKVEPDNSLGHGSNALRILIIFDFFSNSKNVFTVDQNGNIYNLHGMTNLSGSLALPCHSLCLHVVHIVVKFTFSSCTPLESPG